MKKEKNDYIANKVYKIKKNSKVKSIRNLYKSIKGYGKMFQVEENAVRDREDGVVDPNPDIW